MNKKNILTIALVIVIIVIGLLIITLLVRRSNQPTQPVSPDAQSNTTTDSSTTNSLDSQTGSLTGSDAQEKPQADGVAIDSATAVSIIQNARYFSERWGSYSNNQPYQNLHDLQGKVTSSFQTYMDSLETDVDTIVQPTTYMGYVSRVVSVEIVTKNPTSEAEVVVSLQRTRYEGSEETRVVQDLQLRLVNQNGAWLVDDAEWLNE